MTPDSITNLSIPRELVERVLRGEAADRPADVRRLRALADVADLEARRAADREPGRSPLGEAA